MIWRNGKLDLKFIFQKQKCGKVSVYQNKEIGKLNTSSRYGRGGDMPAFRIQTNEPHPDAQFFRKIAI